MVACAALLPAASAAERVQIEVRRDERRFEVHASAQVRADIATAFATLTDYEQLPRFIPGVRQVRVLQRAAAPALAASAVRAAAEERLQIEQRGDFRALWFVRPVVVRLDVVHRDGVEVQAVLSSERAEAPAEYAQLQTFRGRYRVQTIDGGPDPQVRLTYDAEFVPDFGVPPLLGTHVVRSTITDQFDAMVREIERRYGGR